MSTRAVMVIVGVLAAWTSGVECVDALPYSKTAVHGIAEKVYSSGIADIAVEFRRAIHRKPETMYEEYETSALMLRALREMGIAEHNIRTGVAITGVVAHIGAGTLEETLSKHKLNATMAYTRSESGPPTLGEAARALRGVESYIPTVILRADMDALPIHEDNDLAFKSTNDGVMHACGHDSHTAMLLGAAAALKRIEKDLIAMGGSVRLMFQPAEEGGDGALRMIEEGALDGGDAAIMLHTSPELEVGTIATRAGPIMAGMTRLIITVNGVGGHAAHPYSTTDVVVASAAIITGLHGIVSRVIPPTEAAVLSLSYMHGGDAFNVLPNSVSIGGTLRYIEHSTLELLQETIQVRAKSIAAAHGCTCTIEMKSDGVFSNSRGVEWRSSFTAPPVINDEELFELGIATAREVFGEEAILRLPDPSMGGEDFSFLSNVVPSLMAWIGHRSPEHPKDYRTGNNLHNAKLELDERMIPRGASFLASMAMKTLERFLFERLEPIDAAKVKGVRNVTAM